ncbi:PAS domain S-box protein [Mariprofundus erugo]|uniref:histidine kinase n=1 Tax=Mariprofundus erugo TaxID=2528639 RepID=A0A5R9GMN0_9PROT|nr:PhnD/SsuA/transferrin family substrate-binding protein [Mariprofundus erugo]TLS67631.1 PAS domain S-box protein [Mariprofundus erugo]
MKQILLLLVIIPLFSSPAWAESLRIGILSLAPTNQTTSRWHPLQHYLENKLATHIEIIPMDDAQLLGAIQKRSIDFAITSPGHYVQLEFHGLVSRALATQVKLIDGKAVASFGGVIITRSDRKEIRSLHDLKGRRIAATAPDSLGGYQMQAYELFRAGTDLSGLRMVWTDMPDNKVIQAVLHGVADAGFIRAGIIEQLISAGKLKADRLRIIHRQMLGDYPFATSTRLYPEWPVVALPQVPSSTVNNFTAALLSMPHGGALAGSMGLHGFNVAANYEPVRNIMRTMAVNPYDQIPDYFYLQLWKKYHYFFIAIALLLVLILLLMVKLRISNAWIKASSLKMERLIRSMPGVSYQRQHDEHATILFISEQTRSLFGYPADDFTPPGQRNLIDMIHPDDRSRVLATIEQALDEHSEYSIEYRVMHRDGSSRRVFENGQGIYQGNGSLHSLVGTIVDHSAEYQLQQLRIEKEKMASTSVLIGGIAHNFNNILAGMAVQLYLAKGACQAEPSLRNRLEKLEGMTFQMGNVIRPLLTFIQHDLVERTPLVIQPVIQQAIDSFARRTKITVPMNITLLPDDFIVLGNQAQVESVIHNLLQNAADAVAQVHSPVITITLEEKQPDSEWLDKYVFRQPESLCRYVCLTIQDNGAGIDKKDLPHVMEPFYTTKEPGQGTGLGLSVVFGIVQEMAGFLGIDSSPGLGTRVQIYLPHYTTEPACPPQLLPGHSGI